MHHRIGVVVTAAALFTLAAACSTGADTSDGAASDADSSMAIDATQPTTPTAASPDDTTPPTAPAPTSGAPATLAPTTTVEPYTSDVYAGPEHWMCRADTDDTCDSPLDVTVVAADGSTTVRPGLPDPQAPVDCFYVYPTSSEDPTLNSDRVAGAELGVLAQQAARFNEVCTIYAPVYRSVTLAGLFGQAEGDRASAWGTAYDDVVDAWRHYLANDNGGRGVLLIGHSQGAGHLARLLAEEIDGDARQRALLVAAYLIGSAVAVPAGADVGGDLQQVPLCRSFDATGCIVTYATFRASSPPPPDALFGRPRSDQGVAGCVNPAAPQGGRAEVSSAFSSGAWARADRSFVPPTPFMDLPGLVTAECVERDGFSYLEIDVAPDPADPRADDIEGDLSPQWGLHVVDIAVVGGSLLEMARLQVEAFENRM